MARKGAQGSGTHICQNQIGIGIRLHFWYSKPNRTRSLKEIRQIVLEDTPIELFLQGKEREYTHARKKRHIIFTFLPPRAKMLY